jgi:hypothetical protein
MSTLKCKIDKPDHMPELSDPVSMIPLVEGAKRYNNPHTKPNPELYLQVKCWIVV